MARATATATKTADRVELLAGMILAGSNHTESLAYARQTWGVSRSQGYKLMKRAWAQIKDDIDETRLDRKELLSWAIPTLITANGQAMKQKNPGAVVSCIRQLDWMAGLGINSTNGHRVHRTRLRADPIAVT